MTVQVCAGSEPKSQLQSKMRRAYSVDNVLNAKFKTLDFTGEWADAVGSPELRGSWIVVGYIKNGKTSFTMKLCKYLTRFQHVLYVATEEGLSLSIQAAYLRNKMKEVAGKFTLIEEESVEELIDRLKRHKSPNIVVIDTVQWWDLTMKDYRRLKKEFPNKLFIYVSHTDANRKDPDGVTAKKILRDANISWRIEGFKSFPTGRYGGGEPIVISEQLADAYWGLNKKTDNK